MSNLRDRFPELIPMETIRVESESHLYEVIEYEDSPDAVKQQYVPDKAPFAEIEEVVGQVNGADYTFIEGTDYEIVDTNNDGRDDAIDFSIGGTSPDANTAFQITYLADSIIYRYVGSYSDEFSRLGNDVENVIDSRYVDEATDTGYIDNFEDEEIVEYETDYCKGNVGVQSDIVLQGDWALKMQNECNDNPLTITSTSGLQRYPRRDDTFVYYMQLTNDGDIGYFDFMHQNEASERYYSVRINSETDEFIIQKNNGSNKKGATSVDLSQYLGEWLRVEVRTTGIGDMDAMLYNSSNTEIASTSITDTEYSSGGIRWRAFNSTGTGIVYADAADITRRKSADLENIGSIFGELGKRRGRSDDEYATFLRSIVQSFSGRGTVDGIKFAVASALDLPPEQIDIDEDFTTNEYVVNIERPFPPHELITLTELADLADPSGVEFGSISYDVADERVGVTDAVTSTTGKNVTEDVGTTDTALVNQNLIQISEDTGINETVSPDVTNTGWDTGDWNDSDWTIEHN